MREINEIHTTLSVELTEQEQERIEESNEFYEQLESLGFFDCKIETTYNCAPQHYLLVTHYAYEKYMCQKLRRALKLLV